MTLRGSWDNFSKPYTMERDSRRDRGQWRGCHAFRGIICDGDSMLSQGRDGGLKMGHTYYYYVSELADTSFSQQANTALQYELDGKTEAHDASMPSTSHCPYLPGQTVNTLCVPIEEASRLRRASVSSLRAEEFQTRDPDTRFMSPRPAPSPPLTSAPRNAVTAPEKSITKKRSARSLSPGPSGWSFPTRKLFSRKTSSSSLRDSRSPTRTLRGDEQSDMAVETKNYETLSPASLRRFLAEDASVRERKETEAKLSLTIFQEIVEENEDDDDNFATSAKSEAAPFTILSPPPSMRSHSPSPPSTIVPQCSRSPPTSCQNSLTPTSTPASVYGHKSHFSIDSSCCALSESESESESEFPPPFSHSDDDDDDRLSVKEEDSLPSPSMSSEPENLRSLPRNLGAGLSTYSLPSSSPEDGKLSTSRNATPLGLIGTSGLPTQRSIELPTSNTPLLESPIPHAGFDDLASDLDWVVNAVGRNFL